MANTRQLCSLPKGGRHDCNQNRGEQDLGPKSKPETPLRRIADQCPSRSTDDTDQNRDETPNGLHTRYQDSSNKADNDADKEAADEAGNFHSPTQPFLHPIGQERRAEKEHENTFSDSHP